MSDDPTEECENEVLAVRGGVGVADLSARGKLRITGRDRIEWLHNIVSNTVKTLEVGEGNYGTFLTDRGKMVGDYRLVVRPDYLLLDTEPEIKDSLPSAMERFLISEDVEIHREHDAYAILGVFGRTSAETLSRAFGSELPSLPLYGSTEMNYDGDTILVSRQNRTGEIGFDVWSPVSLKQRLTDAFIAAGATLVGDAALEVLRVEAGIARYGVDMNDEIIPLEARLDHAIHYEKGCYIGQEIVARMHYRGHPNKLLMPLRFDGDAVPPPQTDIFPEPGSDKRNGWVTSAVLSPTLNAVVGLGYIRAQQATDGARFVAKTTDGWVPVEVSTAPLVKSSD
jgi:folate-binding protein YgfZ